jgi:hypothetical protein
MSYTRSEFTPYFVDPKTGQPTLNDTNGVRILEPNPIGETVPHEDLFIYVSLTARQKSKTILTSTNEGVKPTTTVRNDIKFTVPHVAVESIPGNTLFKTKPTLTTDWTEIGGWRSPNDKLGVDYEGFGITNIDIEIKSQTAPKVVIDFVDIRGATLFEQGSCSPYGLFFNLPYPIFELTVKGYYGKAVNYYLNLVKFNTKFNSDTGNMECRAEFIGYTFAFLSDTIVSYVQASQKLKEDTYHPQQILEEKYKITKEFYEANNLVIDGDPGTTGSPWCGNVKSQTKRKCTTIYDLLNSLKTFELDQKPKIVGSTEYEELSQLIELESAYRDYLNLVTNLVSELETALPSQRESTLSTDLSVSGQPLRFYTTTSEQAFNLTKKDGGILYNYFNKTDSTDGTKGLLANVIINILGPDRKIGTQSVYEYTQAQGKPIKCLVSDPTQFNTVQKTYPLYNDTELNKQPWMIGLLNLLDYPPIENEGAEVTNEQARQSGTLSGVLDLGYIIADIRRELDLLNNSETGILTVKRREVINAVNDIVTESIGFKPTIRNIFTVLLCNTDAFMEILLNVAIRAEEFHNKEDLKIYTTPSQGTSEILSSNAKKPDGGKKVYPWPTYLEKTFVQKKSIGGASAQQGTKEVYPGSKFPTWPEVIFVEDFIKAFLEFQDDIDVLNEKTEGKPGYDNFVPINPLESQYWEDGSTSPIKYFGLTATPDIDLVVGERLFLSLDHTLFQPIRLTPDSIKIPKIGNSNWTPLNSKNIDVNDNFLAQIAKVDAWNLVNAMDNQKALDGYISNGLSEDAFIKRIKTALGEGKVWKEGVVATSIGKLDTTEFTSLTDPGYVATDKYYVFKTTDDGIVIKTTKAGNITVKPNPFNMDSKYLIKIIDPEIDTTVINKKITLSNPDFTTVVDTYHDKLIAETNDIVFGSNSYQPGKPNFPDKLVGWEKNQQIISFDTLQFYTTLAMVFSKNDPKFSNWWTTASHGDNGYNAGAISPGGSFVSNMGMITFWNDYIATDKTPNLISFLTTTAAYDVASTKYQKVWNSEFFTLTDQKIKLPEGGTSGSDNIELTPAINPKQSLVGDGGVGTPLVTTPLWLDNVNSFRGRRSGYGLNETGGLNPDDEAKNLAYLFLHSIKTTPLITRLTDSNGYLAYGNPANATIGTDSIIWALKAFNNSGGIAKVPKAWLLTLGAQLWRWREFTGSQKGDWKKPLTCIKCNQGQTPNGKDPLVQPGFNSFDSKLRFRVDDSDYDFRNNVNNNYLNKIYNITANPFKYKSVFSASYQYYTEGSYFSYPGGGEINEGDDTIVFGYYNLYSNSVGGIGKYLINETTLDPLDKYSWPQTYIAPHHIPYISPNTWYDSTNGEGSAFTMVTDNWIGKQDYITIMPETFTGGEYYEGTIDPAATVGINDSGNAIDEYSHRSKYEDGNLGMIIQYLNDDVKDMIVDKFEDWATSEWKNTILPIVDPVNFKTNGSLTTSYSYQGGKNNTDSPAFQQDFLNNPKFDGAYVLALKPDQQPLTDLLNKQYWILNSTPKIWYGYGKTGGVNNDPTNQFYEDGFVVSEGQFNKYLKNFLATYKEAKEKRKKELEDQGKNENGGLGDTILDDDDTKLGLYRVFKSLTDKWISSSDKGRLFFNITNASDGRGSCGNNGTGTGKRTTLAAHFQYVNRVMGDIGDLAVIDITKLNELRDNLKISLYQYISDLLVDNEYLFFPLPTYVNLTGKGVSGEDLKDMFRPSLLDVKDISCGPLFLCMYVGGGSRQLKFKFTANCPIDQEVLDNIEDDGFSFSDGNLPSEIADPKITDSRGDKGSNGYTAFRVVYGLENQNHFKNIQLDQSEFSETAESLLVIDKLSQQGGNDQTSKGQNLNAAYLTRSYTCTIESLGNMMIQPMTYFDLIGVPMFNGAYLITEVRHNFKPNNSTTTFKGVRQPKATVPVVTDVALAMNISFKGVKGTGTGSITTISGAGSITNIIGGTANSGGYPAEKAPVIDNTILQLFANPVSCDNVPRINSQYGFRKKGGKGDFHNAVDIGFGVVPNNTAVANGEEGVTAGTSKPAGPVPVFAAYDGTVIRAGSGGGFGAPPNGGVIIIRHGLDNGNKPFSDGYFYFTVYGHCNPSVAENAIVKKGDKVGEAVWPNCCKDDGTRNYNTGLHLHYEVHRSDKANGFIFAPSGEAGTSGGTDINPTPFLNKSPNNTGIGGSCITGTEDALSAPAEDKSASETPAAPAGAATTPIAVKAGQPVSGKIIFNSGGGTTLTEINATIAKGSKAPINITLLNNDTTPLIIANISCGDGVTDAGGNEITLVNDNKKPILFGKSTIVKFNTPSVTGFYNKKISFHTNKGEISFNIKVTPV